MRFFGRYWRCDFLVQPQVRSKWYKDQEGPQERQLVIVKYDIHSPTKWPIDVVVALYPGVDDLVRVVEVKVG